MSSIRRIGQSPRWSDIVIHRGVARWVEVAEDVAQDAQGQIGQVLAQIDQTLEQVGSGRDGILEILIFLADLNEAAVLNERWDQWVPRGHAPIRACMQAGLAGNLRVEMIVTAAVHDARYEPGS